LIGKLLLNGSKQAQDVQSYSNNS